MKLFYKQVLHPIDSVRLKVVQSIVDTMTGEETIRDSKTRIKRAVANSDYCNALNRHFGKEDCNRGTQAEKGIYGSYLKISDQSISSDIENGIQVKFMAIK